MAYFARLNENNEVIHMEVVVNSVIIDEEGNEQEQLGIDFLTQFYGGGIFKQTSYKTVRGVHTEGKTPFRKNYAGVGYTYDPVRDAFIRPKPYPSWILDEFTCDWEPPIPIPEDNKPVEWDEDTTSWIEIIRDEYEDAAVRYV